MTLYHWSQTAANNATADITCPFPEGQAPSSINDGARGVMAAVAKFRDDISGQIATTGTSTAYSVSSFQGFDSLADMHGKEVWFTPHTTNGATVTLNVDTLGNKPLRTAPGVELASGTIVQGTPYGAIYNNSDGAWYLKGSPDPYRVPIGVVLEWYDDTLPPEGGYCWANGQIIASANTVCPVLLARWGGRFGGNGTTTMGVPDRRELTPIGRAGMGGTGGRGLTSFGGYNVVGSIFGEQNHTLSQAEMPSHFHSASIFDPGHTHGVTGGIIGSSSQSFNYANGGTQGGPAAAITISAATTGVRVNSANGLDTTYSAGSNGAHNNMQPSIVCNYILRLG